MKIFKAGNCKNVAKKKEKERKKKIKAGNKLSHKSKLIKF